jgi:hypothetical protein
MLPTLKSLLVAGIVFLAALTHARSVIPDSPTNLTSVSLVLNTTAQSPDPLDEWDSSVTAAEDDPWTLSVARGAKLLQSMKGSDAEAAILYNMGSTAESPFDGDLIDKLQEWGYNDNTDALAKMADPECNFDSPSGHMLKTAFTDLDIGLSSKKKGGPNTCFQIEHHSSPAVKLSEGKLPEKVNQRYEVCGTEYRVTNAEHTIGVNTDAGAIYAMQLSSAAKAARRLWKRTPLAEELPHIRSVSDIAWAFWNRAHVSSESVQDIRYLFVTMIINPETNRHVKRALSSLDPPREEADGWPGHDFGMDTEAGKALLGSPVGRWAGYFLMQHKRQLGGNKQISKVRVFKSEKEGSWPYFLFYVEGGDARGDGQGEVRVLERSFDGRSVVREHVLRGRL